MKRALVLSLICVLGLGFSSLAASLTGSWDTDVTIDPQQISFADAISLTSVLTVNYIVGDWTFTSITSLTEAGWKAQKFTAGGVLGAFTLTSDLVFDPTTPAFTSWETTAAVSIAGVSFGADFTLKPNITTLELTGSGVAGDVSVDVTLDLGSGEGCDFDFSGITIDVGFPFCCADISSEIVFTCAGFSYITFEADGIAVPNLPWLSFDALLKFTTQTKSLVLTPSLDFGTFACIDLNIGINYTPNTNTSAGMINYFTISGISLTCDIGAVTFTGASTFVPIAGAYYGPYPWLSSTANNPLNSYWEYYKIETNDDACCGPFTFDLAVYFQNGGGKLFDVGLIDANMTLQVATQFTFNMGLTVDVDSGAFTQWTVGFLVTW